MLSIEVDLIKLYKRSFRIWKFRVLMLINVFRL